MSVVRSPDFLFLAVCNMAKKCIFVRVVDTCAGCKPGSHHIDLPEVPFRELANPNDGVRDAYFREAEDPSIWSANYLILLLCLTSVI